MKRKIKRVIISEKRIRERVKKLGKQITKDYKNKKLLLISILKGSIVFVGDLYRHIEIPCELDFMKVSSYKGNTRSTGEIKIYNTLSSEIKNKNILLIEDILDSGKTLEFVKEKLRKQKPKSITVCVLLEKRLKRKNRIEPDYIGFKIKDEFVVGYGLDYKEKYRNLPFIGVLKK